VKNERVMGGKTGNLDICAWSVWGSEDLELQRLKATGELMAGTGKHGKKGGLRLTPEFRDRTKRFASEVAQLYEGLPRERKEVAVAASQMLRAGISVAGQTREASRANSRAGFTSKIENALQEADETLFWLELLREECGFSGELFERVCQESGELTRIFVIIACSLKNSKRLS
jgi:four helix bundle protein